MNALKSLKANSNIKVVISDKGKETVVCYRATYLVLSDAHFSNINLYQPVNDDDVAGSSLDAMTERLTDELKNLASQTSDIASKNLIKGLMPPKEPRFPEGRVSLKTHKSGITPTNIPVRPIISNSNAPTSPLASYLGKCLTEHLGQISDKHVRSTEEFADFMKDCTTEGRLMSLDVENLFTCIPVKKVIKFLRDMSHGWGNNPPAEAEPAATPVYSFGIDSKLFCDLIELVLSINQFHLDGRSYH